MDSCWWGLPEEEKEKKSERKTSLTWKERVGTCHKVEWYEVVGAQGKKWARGREEQTRAQGSRMYDGAS